MSRGSILVSGAGIAGPTVAYWLLKRGFAPVLIERAPRFRDGGYIIDFWGVGYDVAERMGLISALRKCGYIINRLEFVDERGARRSGMEGNVFQRTLGERFFSMQREDLANGLYGTVEHEVETIFGDSISAISQNAECAEVTFEHGRPRTFDVVIGADGLHSTVRAAVFGPSDKSERYLGYYAASFVTSGYEKRDEHAYYSYAAPGRQISRYSLRDDRTAFLFVFACKDRMPDLAHDLPAQKQMLRRIFSREEWIEWPEIERRLEVCEELYFDAVTQITMPKWSHGRTALTGDAAYCPSLLAGEGASFAMAGGYILARELERAGGDHARAFAAYEHNLRPFIERKQKTARGFAASFAPKTAWGLFVRDQVLRLSAIPAVGDFFMRRFVEDRFVLKD